VRRCDLRLVTSSRPLRVVAAGCASVLLAGLLSAVESVPSAVVPHAAAATATVTAKPDLYSAMVAARSQGSPVQLSSLTTETSTTSANPDGSLSTEQDGGPVRVRQADGSWAAVDLTLVSSNGVLAPRMSAQPFVLSAGGSTVAASENVAGGTVQVGWPTALPVPTLSGSTATYPNVSPGVDLVVQALRTGFSADFVVRSKPSTALSLPLTLSLKGLSAAQQADGSLRITDAKGATVGTGGTPVMFGAATMPGTDFPSRRQSVAAGLSAAKAGSLASVSSPAGTSAGTSGGSGTSETWSLSPDLSFLSDPSVTYPVTVDPSFAFVDNADTYVKSNVSTSQYSATRLYVGTPDAGATVARTYLGFAEPAAMKYTYVSDAYLQLYNSYSSTCTAKPVYVYSLSGPFTSTTTWTSKPNPVTLQGTGTWSHAGPAGQSCTGVTAYDNIPVTGLINDWANNPGHLEQLQVSASETSTTGWKEFYSSEVGSGIPALHATYYIYPNTPGMPVMSPATGTAPASYWTKTATPTLSAPVGNSSGAAVQGRFEIYIGNTLFWSGLGNTVQGSGTSKVTVPASAGLAAGTLYTVRVWGITGPAQSKVWSNYFQFHVDTTAPGAPTVTTTGTPAGFSNGQWTSTAPTANTFTFTQPSGTTDTTAFQYQLDGGAWTTKTATSGAASLAWLPTSGGHTLNVRGTDAAGNVGTTTPFTFGVGPTALSTTQQTQVAGYAPISGSGPTGATGGYLRWSPRGAATWTQVPAANLLSNGTIWTGTGITTSGGVSTTPRLVVDLVGAGVPAAPVSVDLQLCLTYPTGPAACSSATTPVTVQRVPHDTAATSSIGPGSVALATGEFTYTATDSAVPGYSGSLGVSRTLLSLDAVAAKPGPFGPGWAATLPTPDAGYLDSTITDHLTAGSGNDGTIEVGYPDGSADTYTDPTWVPGTGDTHLGTAPVVLGYTGQGDTDTSATTVTLSIDQKTLTIQDPDGTVTTFKRTTVPGPFTPSGVTEPETQVGGQGTTSAVTTNTGALPPGAVIGDTWTSTVQGAPGVSCTTVIVGCRALTVVYAGPATATPTDAAPGPYPGQVREEVYTAYNAAKTGGAGLDTVITAVFSYDHLGRLVGTYDPRADVTTGTHLITGYGYDSSNRLTSITPPGLNAWTLTYDTTGRLATVSRVDPANDTATSTVAYGVPLTGSGLPSMAATDVATWGQPSSGAPVTAVAVFNPDHVPAATPTSTDWPYAAITYLNTANVPVNTASYGVASGTADWRISTTVYDNAGRVVSSLTPGNRAIALSGTSCPDLVASLVCAQPGTQRAILLSNQTVYSATDPTEVTDTFGPAVTATLPDGTTATSRAHKATTYDEGAPAGLATTLGVTALRLPTTVTDSGYVIDALTDPAALSGGVDTDTRTTSNGYDPIDGASVTGPTSGWVFGQPTAVTVAGSITTRTLFDPAGRVRANRQPASTGTDQGTRVTVYYTAAVNAAVPGCGGRPEWDGLVCQTNQAGTGAALPTSTVTGYSMLLAPATVTDRDATGTLLRQTDTTFDAAGRVTKVVTAEPTGSADTPVPDATYGFWPLTGLPKTSSSTAGTATSTYDALGRVTSQTDGTGANTATTAYDIDSRPVTVTDAKGTTTYTYDSTTEHRGLLTGLTVGLGGGLPSTYGNLVYDAAGALTSFTFPNGVVQADVTDPAGNLTARGYTDSAGTPVASWTRGYTLHGQVATEAGPSAAGARAQADTYDAAGRLIQVSDLLGAVCTVRKYTFTTDSARTGLSTWTGPGDGTCPTTTPGVESSKRTGTVNSFDQLTATTVTGTGAGSGTYGYDALGRVITLPGVDVPGEDKAHDVALGYFANDLAAKQTQGTTTRAYTLDAVNRLGSWIDTAGATSTTTVNHYDDSGDSPTWTGTGAGTWTRQTASPAGVIGIIATGTTGAGTATTAVVQLVNPHGDITATIPDTTGATAASLGAINDTDEYGNTITPGGSVYGWVGGHNRITDTTTGLAQMGIRIYNPMTGSFESVDVVYGGNANSYGYPGDPVNGYDLDGRCWDHFGWVCGVVRQANNFTTSAVGFGYRALVHVGGGRCQRMKDIWECKNRWHLFGGGGTTLGNTFVTDYRARSATEEARLLVHERRHVKQWRSLGHYMVAAYAIDYAVHHGNPCRMWLERSAGLRDGGYNQCG